MGAENQKPPINPLDELKNLDQQVELVTELADLKPIFLRLDEIAKQRADDFEVQLVVGDIKQHLVNRGTRLKEQRPPAPQPIPGPAAPPPVSDARPLAPTVKAPRIPPVPPSIPPPIPGPAATPPVRPVSSDQFANPQSPSLSVSKSINVPPRPAAPRPSAQTSTLQMATPGPLNTGQQPPMMAQTDPIGGAPPQQPAQPPQPRGETGRGINRRRASRSTGNDPS